MGKKVIQMEQAKNQGASAPISNKSKIDGIREDFSKNIQGAATSFGALLGMAKWYSDMFPAAMEQLKQQGCKYCNHLHCKKCKEEIGTALSGWAWDMGKRHES